MIATKTERRSRNAAVVRGESERADRMMKRKVPTVLIEMHHNHLTCKKSPGVFAGRASELQLLETSRVSEKSSLVFDILGVREQGGL